VTPIKNNLVALGSAAVVAVYAAGYVRTREAADRFAVEDSQRRQEHERRVATHQTRDTGPETRDTSVQVVAAAPVATTAHEEATPKRSEVSKPKPAHRTETAPVKAHVDSVPAPVPDTATKVIESPPPVSVPVPVTAPPAPGMTFKVTPPASADTTNDADKPLKDGVYSGYGRSRHGDIEATVSIKNGKIAEAFISQCLTQYSCSWIAALPPQVVARQSAEVDYVSGATQSTNAFYYAVVAALKKAK
jgi:uncharacterized protein with FMN-binding domain